MAAIHTQALIDLLRARAICPAISIEATNPRTSMSVHTAMVSMLRTEHSMPNVILMRQLNADPVAQLPVTSARAWRGIMEINKPQIPSMLAILSQLTRYCRAKSNSPLPRRG
jgi:hypothetical protein